jgi:hypothetical protein
MEEEDRMEEEHPSRLSWEEAHRLEVTLRARSNAMSHTGRAVGRCPGCGRPIADGEDAMRVGGLVVHPGCLFVCREDRGAAAPERNRRRPAVGRR